MNAYSFNPTPIVFEGAIAADSAFEVGDIVTLLTGSPPMTVLSVCDECGDVDVAWYDDSMQVYTLPDEALVRWVDPDE